MTMFVHHVRHSCHVGTTRRGLLVLALLFPLLTVMAAMVFSQDTPSEDVLSGAAVVSPGVQSDERVFEEPDQVHWYRFEAVAGQVYSLAADNGASNVILEVYTADGEILLGTKESPDGAGPVPVPPVGDSLVWVCPEDGVYLVKVHPNVAAGDALQDGGYTLNLGFAAAAFSGFVSGTVTDARSGAPIAGALVTTGMDASCPTQENGGYLLLHAPGTFTLTVTAPGFREWNRSGLLLEEGASLVVDAALVPDDGQPMPDPPVIRYPGDGAVDVPPAPCLEIGEFHHPDTARRHARTRWRVVSPPDESPAFDLVSSARLTALDLPAFVLLPHETYQWCAQVEDDAGVASPWSVGAVFFIMADVAPDADGNGVPDDQDVPVTVDLDGNGVPDRTQKDLRAARTSTGRLMAVSLPGYVGSPVRLLRTEPVHGDPLPGGADGDAIRFRVSVEKAGGDRTVTIWRDEVIPDSTQWYLQSPERGWESSPAVRSADGRSVTITLTDGGSGDLDGTANGVVVGLTASSAPSSGEDGGGGCFLRVVMPGS